MSKFIMIGLGFILVTGSPLIAKAGEAAVIRALDETWSKAADQKDATTTAHFYSEEGTLLPPNAPIVNGRENIQKTWAGLMAAPGFGIHFAPTKIVVAKGNDMAYDIGTYELTLSNEQGQPTKQVGKYLVCWRKDKRGTWKVMADMFSDDK
jgi:uncharacterized protein (TIGR02246 family)